MAAGLCAILKGTYSQVNVLLQALIAGNTVHSVTVKAMGGGLAVVTVGYVAGGTGQQVQLISGDFQAVQTGINAFVTSTVEYVLDSDVLSYGPIGSSTASDGSQMVAVVVFL
jgi:hypothetical protein